MKKEAVLAFAQKCNDSGIKAATTAFLLPQQKMHLLGQEDTTVAHLALVESLAGGLDALDGHGEGVEHGLDAVAGGELEHAAVGGAAGDDGALDSDALGQEGHVGDDEVARLDGKGEHDAVGSHDGEVGGPVCLISLLVHHLRTADPFLEI